MMGLFTQLNLKFVYILVEVSNQFIFAFKLAFFKFQVVYLNLFSFNIGFKFSYLFVLLLRNSLDDIFLDFLESIFDLSEVSLDDVCHPAEVLKQRGDFMLQHFAKGSSDFGFQLPDHTLNLFLVSGVMRDQDALEFHDCLNDELELVHF
jgi:hypothetical protein